VTARRLAICYAAPGHAFVPTAGATRNMLALAAALGTMADVTLAFRRGPEGSGDGYRVIAIEPGPPPGAGAVDDVAARGLDPLRHLAYVRRLRAFARARAGDFDVVLEKGWRLSGALLAAFRRHGVPGVLVENDVRWWAEPVADARTLARYALHLAAGRAARAWVRRVPIIAETEELRAMLVRHRRVDPARVEVVALGVDHARFRPLDQAAARRALGIDPAATVLLYVGGLDAYHDLAPVIEALAGAARPVELHVVGDGVRAGAYRALAARTGAPVRFHGPRPHAEVPAYIAAADACLAPYRERAFPGDTVPFSTLKVPEYMACGRPVIGVPGGHVGRLVEPGVSGFLLPNEPAAWRALLARLPPRPRLAEMGRAAARAVTGLTWERTAARYLAACERAAAGGRRARSSPCSDMTEGLEHVHDGCSARGATSHHDPLAG